MALTAEDLAEGFQVSPDNPLVGLEGRAALLNRLGRVVATNPDIFGQHDDPRPGGLFDVIAATAENDSIRATAILEALLTHLGPIWPGRITLGGVDLGDTWRHPLVEAPDATKGLVPFHKLSQWLSYSLIEPLEWAGFTVVEIDGLTGLPEYRNGGLFLDTGVIALKDPADAAKAHAVDSQLVVEWRALDGGASRPHCRSDPREARICRGGFSPRQGARRRHLGDGAAAGEGEARRRLAPLSA